MYSPFGTVRSGFKGCCRISLCSNRVSVYLRKVTTLVDFAFVLDDSIATDLLFVVQAGIRFTPEISLGSALD